jgi:hypothetical protein
LSILPSIDVFPMGFGKSIIYQFFVMLKSCLVSDVNKRAVAFVILPLKSIGREQFILITFIYIVNRQLSRPNSIRVAECNIQ